MVMVQKRIAGGGSNHGSKGIKKASALAAVLVVAIVAVVVGTAAKILGNK